MKSTFLVNILLSLRVLNNFQSSLRTVNASIMVQGLLALVLLAQELMVQELLALLSLTKINLALARFNLNERKKLIAICIPDRILK